MSSGPGLPPAGAPWYRQFWPWFLICLPAVAVAASIASLVIALKNADSLVREDWSEAGDGINAELALEREARARDVSVTITLDPAAARLAVTLDGRVDALERLELDLRHPTDASRDVSLTLDGDQPRRFVGDASAAMVGSWYLTVAPPGREWLLRKRVWLAAGDATRVAATAGG